MTVNPGGRSNLKYDSFKTELIQIEAQHQPVPVVGAEMVLSLNLPQEKGNDMVRVAIPVSDDKLSEQFEQCSHYLIYEIDENASVSQKIKVSAEELADGLPGSMQRYGITDVIAHGISKDSLRSLAETKINLFVGVAVNDPKMLLEEYLKGSLRSDIRELID